MEHVSRVHAFSTHDQVKKLTIPAGVSADRDLSRFHQQKAQARVALFADVSSLPLQCPIEDREGGSANGPTLSDCSEGMMARPDERRM